MTTSNQSMWTLIVWRCLCLLAIITGFAAITGYLFFLPHWMQGAGVAVALLVVLLHVVSSYADSSRGSRR